MSQTPPQVAPELLPKERRSHVRHLFDSEATVVHPLLGELEGRTRDRSSGGVYVLLAEALDMKEGDIVQLRIRQLCMKMQVVRIEDDGVALKVVLD